MMNPTSITALAKSFFIANRLLGPSDGASTRTTSGSGDCPAAPLLVPLLRILAIINYGQRKSGLGGRASAHGSVSRRGEFGARILLIIRCGRTHWDWPRKGHSPQVSAPPLALNARSALG